MYVLDIQYLLSVLLVDALSRPYIILRTIISRNYLAATRLLKTQREMDVRPCKVNHQDFLLNMEEFDHEEVIPTEADLHMRYVE